MKPNTVDFIADMAYGLLIAFSVVLLNVFGDILAAGTFAFGVLLAFIVHVWWQMARFDPEWMTEQQVREQVEEHVEQRVEAEVTARVEDE